VTSVEINSLSTNGRVDNGKPYIGAKICKVVMNAFLLAICEWPARADQDQDGVGRDRSAEQRLTAQQLARLLLLSFNSRLQ
jgi:hypothetical protein